MILFMRSIRKIALRRGCMCVVVPLLVVCEWRADTHVQRRRSTSNVTVRKRIRKILSCAVYMCGFLYDPHPGTAGPGAGDPRARAPASTIFLTFRATLASVEM